MKKQAIMLLLSLIFACIAMAQRPKKYYKDQVEAGEKLLSARYQGIFILTAAGDYVHKIYYPEKKIMTHSITYSDEKFQMKDGPYREWYDNGQLWKAGVFKQNKPEDSWSFYTSSGKKTRHGRYVNGEEEGIWHYFDRSGRINIERTYQKGKLHGDYKIFDTAGNLAISRQYEAGVLVAEQSFETSAPIDMIGEAEIFPYLNGCENDDPKKQKRCSDQKLLEFIYGQIKYPEIAREKDAEGTVIFQFIVEKDGRISGLETLRGVCASLEAESLRVVRNMPEWSPGMQDGKPVRVEYRFPIRFKLE